MILRTNSAFNRPCRAGRAGRARAETASILHVSTSRISHTERA